MEMENKFQERFNRSSRLRLYRKTCGAKAFVFAEMIGVDQAEYSKKENGYSNVKDEHLDLAKEYFHKWRQQEINRLEERIKFLKEIV